MLTGADPLDVLRTMAGGRRPDRADSGRFPPLNPAAVSDGASPRSGRIRSSGRASSFDLERRAVALDDDRACRSARSECPISGSLEPHFCPTCPGRQGDATRG